MHRVAGQAVWVVAGAAAAQDLAGGLVDGHHLVGVGGGGVHAVAGGDDEDSVDAGQAAVGIDALVVEAGVVTRQADLSHGTEWKSRPGGLAVARDQHAVGHHGGDDQTGGQSQQGAGTETRTHGRASRVFVQYKWTSTSRAATARAKTPDQPGTVLRAARLVSTADDRAWGPLQVQLPDRNPFARKKGICQWRPLASDTG